MAERNTFSITGAIRLVEKWTVFSACSTRMPLMVSRTSFAFCGLVRWNLASARNSRTFSTAIFDITLILQTISAPAFGASCTTRLKPKLLGLRGGLGCTCGVALERARRGELAQLMTHHVLRHVDRDELAA